MKRYHARKAIIEALKEKNLFIEDKDNSMVLQVCSKSGDIIEPLMKPQWWVKCAPLTENVVKVNIIGCQEVYQTECFSACSALVQASFKSVQHSQRTSGTAGWRILRTGAFPGSCGGDTVSPLTMQKSRASQAVPAKTRALG